MELGRCPVHPSLVRPILVAGVERRVLILEATLAAAILIAAGVTIASCAAALLIAFVIHPLLRRLSRRDPDALAVYARSLRYAGYYPRVARPRAPLSSNQPFNVGV